MLPISCLFGPCFLRLSYSPSTHSLPFLPFPSLFSHEFDGVLDHFAFPDCPPFRCFLGLLSCHPIATGFPPLHCPLLPFPSPLFENPTSKPIHLWPVAVRFSVRKAIHRKLSPLPLSLCWLLLGSRVVLPPLVSPAFLMSFVVG